VKEEIPDRPARRGRAGFQELSRGTGTPVDAPQRAQLRGVGRRCRLTRRRWTRVRPDDVSSRALRSSPELKLGRPTDYAVGSVSEKWVKKHRLWIRPCRRRPQRRNDRIVGVLHAPWMHAALAGDGQLFKCPCHGWRFAALIQARLEASSIRHATSTGQPLVPRTPRDLARGDGQSVLPASCFVASLNDPTTNWHDPGMLRL